MKGEEAINQRILADLRSNPEREACRLAAMQWTKLAAEAARLELSLMRLLRGGPDVGLESLCARAHLRAQRREERSRQLMRRLVEYQREATIRISQQN